MLASTEDREMHLASLSSRFRDLLTTREALIKQLTDHEAILASVRVEYYGLLNEGAAVSSLLDDILAMIFEVAHEFQQKYVELKILHVCKRWQDLALTFPRLWSNIPRRHEHVDIRSIDAYLQRSQEFPISLDIFIKYNEAAHSEGLETFYRLIAPHMTRCRHLHFSCSGDLSGWVRFLDIIQVIKLPLLSHVHLRDIGGEIPEKMVAEVSPLLTALHLSNADIRNFPFSLASVTHLRFDGTHISAAIDVREGLLHMPGLTHLELYASYSTTWEEGWEVQLSRLCVLSISVKALPDFILVVLQALRMPLLEILSLEGYVEAAIAHDASIVESFQRFPSLRQLVLRSSPRPMPYLVAVFPSIIDLTYITVARNSTLQAITFLLAYNPLNASTFWSHLSKVTLPMVKSSEPDGIHHRLMNRQSAWCPLRLLFVPDVPADFDMAQCVEIVEPMGTVRDPARYFE